MPKESDKIDNFIDWEGKKIDGRTRKGRAMRERNPESEKRRLRNLPQYKDSTDDELDEIIAKKQLGVESSANLEKRIDLKLKEFAEDYDISDLKINDKLVLRALVQALLQLEDLEQFSNSLREQGMSAGILSQLREINLMMDILRKGISSMQEDLKITRKHRKGDKEQTALAALEDLKAKAREFYKEAMTYVYCPTCHQLLMTFWIQTPDEKKHKIKLVCNNILGNGQECGTEINMSLKELIDAKTKYNENVPESLN